MARTLYIVRHGNTFDSGDTVTRVGARTDLPLSRSGTAQAEALARHFAEEGLAFTDAITGPLRRTRETTEIIMEGQARPPLIEIADFLREIDYGPDENKPEEDVIARIGEDALKAWEERGVPPPGWIVDPDMLMRAWQDLFTYLARRGNQDPALVVTSNGIARFALLAGGAPFEEAHDLKLKTGAYGVLEVLPGRTPHIAAWNVRP
ncbi:histidine phosphatase family protein [Henriciella aquimarina]|uniref:histidine phosphatase family protein n=1 Tax=Henriciella aquimarina TaxID=545261 RepID=UPI0009FC46BB|nr:histidine phosphatase family protein [Henriciella aquimarina]